jgi:tRNA (cytidine/uridine-2'-O-)-methyltransferase
MRLALFQPDIPQNLGGAIRLSACFGVPLDVIEPCGFPLSDRAIKRAAMDYGESATVLRHDSWEKFLQARPGGRLVLFTTRGATRLPAFSFSPDDILLFGRESAGVTEAVHAAADARVLIPIRPEARSLNLVASAGIAIAEALRQTNGFPDATR